MNAVVAEGEVMVVASALEFSSWSGPGCGRGRAVLRVDELAAWVDQHSRRYGAEGPALPLRSGRATADVQHQPRRRREEVERVPQRTVDRTCRVGRGERDGERSGSQRGEALWRRGAGIRHCAVVVVWGRKILNTIFF